MFMRVNARVYYAGQPRDVWFVFETGNENMEAFNAAMIEDGQVLGVRYETERMPENRAGRMAFDHYSMILGQEGFSSISELREDLFDKNGDPIFSLDEARAK